MRIFVEILTSFFVNMRSVFLILVSFYSSLAEIPGVARDSRKSDRLNPIELLTPPDLIPHATHTHTHTQSHTHTHTDTWIKLG
jgi:hypothetical protein